MQPKQQYSVCSPDNTEACLRTSGMSTEPKLELAVQVRQCECEMIHGGPEKGNQKDNVIRRNLYIQ